MKQWSNETILVIVSLLHCFIVRSRRALVIIEKYSPHREYFSHGNDEGYFFPFFPFFAFFAAFRFFAMENHLLLFGLV